MNAYCGRDPNRGFASDDNYVVGEILEDIECLDLDGSDFGDTDILNADTFGDFGDTLWDPTETFMEAERIQNSVPTRPKRVSTALEKFSDFDVIIRKQVENRTQRKDQNYRRRDNQKKVVANVSDDTEDHKPETWEEDLKKYKKLGLFDVPDAYVNILAENKAKLYSSFNVSQRTIERHISGVHRNAKTIEREFFINEQELDRILRIQLAQVSKNPKLQSYSGRWNLYHLGIRKPEEEADAESDEEKPDSEKAKQPVNKPNRFGKTSSASVRHGRKLIYLGGDSANPVDNSIVDRHRRIRETIECCYETLYVLCDVEQEIEKCPMNHVSALNKMQKDRDEYLHELFILLTGDLDVFPGILDLNKGRLLVAKVGRKLGIEMKLILLCMIIESLDKFVEICKSVDLALENEETLGDFIALACDAHNLKSLVAFEGSNFLSEYTSSGFRIQNLLFNYSSFTKLFLFILEGITLTGHLYLLTGKDGRHTALQRCCNILIKAQRECKGFEKILSTRSGVIFTNIFLERIRDNNGAVDQNTIDVILHYTLDISEHIVSNQQEWNSLASNIVKMF
ncbi:hypothetical protein BEWA_006050 [Theileria equi strain WA]|uniref:Uncharacterized protein n=1 Tax=Theileria equi strain WA TaxID=1537102 RepID=L0B1R7_THEEQ|nr:hypothetical protein BEWA_006050 [Theileria equi strain WA]AFZ81196.1 hypothetical protein BEWA_006050 [Theileria equi strain WA]|eukprot:XP_004830862.1 hypothetical protein BEWA_006050 [Theileria equi strain WA]